MTTLPVRDGRQVRRLDGLIGRIRVKFNDGAVGDRLCGRRSADLRSPCREREWNLRGNRADTFAFEIMKKIIKEPTTAAIEAT